MNYLRYTIGNKSMSAAQSAWVAVCMALVISSLGVRNAEAQLTIAGELVVDLRGVDLNGASPTWSNQDTTGDTVGDFSTQGGGVLNVVAGVSDGSITAPFALDVNGVLANSVVAAGMTPASIIGNQTRSAEAWLFARNGNGAQTVVALGQAGNDEDSSFNWSNGGNGLFNGWFNDGAWTDPVVTGSWVHVAWTYDGDIVQGYRNGVLMGTYDTVDSNSSGQDLDTTDAPISVGSSRSGASNAFSGYLADVRVHSGLLSDVDVMNNYLQGIMQPTSLACDLDGDGDCDSIDLSTLRNNLFTEGDSSMGDINRDGVINWVDWRLLKDDPNRVVGVVSPGAASAQVPEPTSLACFGVALAVSGGVVFRRRRRLRV